MYWNVERHFLCYKKNVEVTANMKQMEYVLKKSKPEYKKEQLQKVLIPNIVLKHFKVIYEDICSSLCIYVINCDFFPVNSFVLEEK